MLDKHSVIFHKILGRNNDFSKDSVWGSLFKVLGEKVFWEEFGRYFCLGWDLIFGLKKSVIYII